MGTAEIGALRVNLAMNTTEFDKGAKDAGGALDDLGKRFGITAATAKIAALAITAAFVVAAKQIADGVKQAIDKAAELADIAERFKVPIETLAAFASKGGVGVDKLSAGLTKLQENLQAIAGGDELSAAGRSLQAIGVAATDASGKIRPVSDVLGDIADKFAKYEDGVGKSTLATNIFGGAGEALLPILNDGTKGMDDLTDAARAAGMELDGPLAAAAKNVKENLAKLTPTFDELYNKLAVAILPVLDSVLEKMVETAEKVHVLDLAVDVLAGAFKALVSAGIVVSGVFTAISNAAVMTASILKNVIEGEYSKALEVYRAGSVAANENIAETIRGVQYTWSGWATTMEDTAKNHDKKVAAPIVASMKQITESQREWNKLVAEGEALGKKAMTPFETQVKQLKALDAAFEEHKISAELLARAQFQAAAVAQNAYAGMASNIAGSLEKVFSHSKAVAIASALINTYESVTKALATYPPPFSYIAAAASLAAGLVQVANIRKTSKTSSGGGGGGGSSAQAMAGPTQGPQQLMVQGLGPGQLFTSESVKELANKLLAFQRDGGQVVIT